jgi:STAS-like domain of unknown function (DUF4325)
LFKFQLLKIMQDSITTILVIDVVTGTATNTEGIALFNSIDKYLSYGQKIRLSFDGSTPFSTSFLNSSFGELIDKYGIDKIKSMIIYSNIKPSQIKRIQNYFERISL